MNNTLSRRLNKDSLQYFGLSVPATVLFFIFVIYPVFGAIYFSMTNWDGVAREMEFIGLKNYVTLFHDEYVLRPMLQTFVFSFLMTIFQNIVSLVMAVALNRQLRTKGLLRTLWFVPFVISPLIVGYVWSYIFTDPLVKLGKLLNWNLLSYNVLSNRNAALYAGVFVGVWRMAGYTMVIYIAAFQNIPTEINDAVQIDGANAWDKFWKVSFPLIAPAFTINMVLTMERGFKEFDMMFSLTNGGPGRASEIISLTIYRETFEHYRAGYGSAMGVILFFIIAILSILELHFLRKKEENIVY